ncbi:PREDICTED: transmembrane and ubiquitin-like domain-containing protein 1 [Priapulus caudatus]|uniref:Transmembrane and ubiquitin-like domain-containing protein 1 n=1 Tax=Priapulus caudatus TaxID=37621 RepID=A0ABM1ETM4_PRICU|nr:PREDICTED: transmembrane and ubiquitin-like domain-containing protein 1 [Priapulus caudatus]XP_014675547.1 PREDICTED: transmembrane and ubiquitin-like domain-containing protein 1 [Priapulus caudatus]
MPLVEGFGDEVVIVLSAVLGIAVLVVAWFSTSVRDYPWRSIIIVQYRRQSQQAERVVAAEISTSSLADLTQVPPASSQSADAATSASETRRNTVEGQQADCKEREESRQDGTDAAPRDATETVAPVTDGGGQARTRCHDDDYVIGDEAEGAGQSQTGCHGDDAELDTEAAGTDSSSTARKVSTSTSTQDVHMSDARDGNQADDIDELSNPSPRNPSECNEIKEASSSQQQVTRSEIRVRLKYLNESERIVQAQGTDTIEEFRSTHFEEELSAGHRVRFISNGQMLENGARSLRAYGIGDNGVLHVLLTQPARDERPLRDDAEAELDVGHLMFPLFGVVLAVVWYLRLKHKQYFNMTSTLTLVGITALFGLSLFALWRSRREEDVAQQQQQQQQSVR